MNDLKMKERDITDLFCFPYSEAKQKQHEIIKRAKNGRVPLTVHTLNAAMECSYYLVVQLLVTMITVPPNERITINCDESTFQLIIPLLTIEQKKDVMFRAIKYHKWDIMRIVFEECGDYSFMEKMIELLPNSSIRSNENRVNTNWNALFSHAKQSLDGFRIHSRIKAICSIFANIPFEELPTDFSMVCSRVDEMDKSYTIHVLWVLMTRGVVIHKSLLRELDSDDHYQIRNLIRDYQNNENCVRKITLESALKKSYYSSAEILHALAGRQYFPEINMSNVLKEVINNICNPYQFLDDVEEIETVKTLVEIGGIRRIDESLIPCVMGSNHSSFFKKRIVDILSKYE
jgi:hypothetical protein